MSTPVHTTALTVGLLLLGTVVMTSARYARLRELNANAWFVAALASRGIALLECLLQAPADRIGCAVFPVARLKTMQQAITLTVFMPFAVSCLKEPLKLDDLRAGLCTVDCMFRGQLPAG